MADELGYRGYPADPIIERRGDDWYLGNIKLRLTIPTSDPVSIWGYYDEHRRLWIRSILHPDGRQERFVSPALTGEYYEDNP